MTLNVTNDKIIRAMRVIRDHYPGPCNKWLREKLRKQLRSQLDYLETGTQVKLGKGIFWLDGHGNCVVSNLNLEINKALGLIEQD